MARSERGADPRRRECAVVEFHGVGGLGRNGTGYTLQYCWVIHVVDDLVREVVNQCVAPLVAHESLCRMHVMRKRKPLVPHIRW